jgi:translocation and assembly module TamB
VLGGVGLTVGVAAGAVLGLAGAALRTGAGRDAVVRFGLAVANRQLDGSITVHEVGGSFLGGLDAHDVVLHDSSGAEVVHIPRAQLRYRARDLLDGRVVLGELRLSHPLVRLWEDSGGVLNLVSVLRLNQPGSGGRPPLIAFRNVEITDAVVSIATQGRSDRPGAERTITGLSARLPYVRLSSPFPGERPLRFEIADLKADVSDPRVTLIGARGTLQAEEDSIKLSLQEARLPSSTLSVAGTVSWPRDTVLLALDVSARRVATEDLRGIVSTLPAGLTGSGEATVQSESGDVMRVILTNLALVGRGGGGRLSGRLGLVLGPGDRRELVHTDLRSDSLDLDYVRSLLDTLPLAGRLTGRFQADGPEDRLGVDVDWTFQDSLVPGWPTSHLTGGGDIALNTPGGFAFRDFAIREAELDLGTVQRLVPVDLMGKLDVAGTLNGPWKEVEFSGSLRQHDGTLPPTLARGVLRVDARGDRLGLWANMSLDSLELDGLRTSFPLLGVHGAFAGDLNAAGYLDSLNVYARLSGTPGQLAGEGAVFLVGARRGAHWLDARFSHLDLQGLDTRFPKTSLSGHLHGAALLDSLAAPRARATVQLVASVAAGLALDSVSSRLVLADSVLTIDSLSVWAPELVATARGGIGVGETQVDSVRIEAHTDSVGVLEPLTEWLRGVSDSAAPPWGAATLAATISGSLSRFGISARFDSRALTWQALKLYNAAFTGRWHSAEHGIVQFDATADSLAWGRLTFGDVEARAHGRRDSLAWFGRSRLGGNAAWIAGGRMRADSGRSLVVVDSLGLLVPSEALFLTPGTHLVLADSSLEVDSTTLASASGATRVGLAGRLPFRGRGDLRASVENLPLGDAWALMQYDPTEVSGTVSGTATLSGTAAAPVLGAKVALRDIVFRGFRAPYVDGSMSYATRRLAGEFALWRSGQRILDITLDLPIDLALRGAPPDRELPGPISMRVRADSVDLSFVETVVPVIRQTGGRLSADVGITGTWAAPELTGGLTVSNGAATFPALGVRHRDLFGRLTLSGDTIRVDTLSLSSGEGTAMVHGYVRLAELTRPLLNLRIRAEDFRVMDVRDYLSFTASGNLELKGPVYGASLTGRGTVPRGVLYFTDLLEKQVVNLEDVRYADIIDTSLVRRQGLREEFQNRFLDSLQIDSLRLDMGTDVWLRSAEANVQLTGSLTVNKAANRYRLVGTLQTPRGTYRLPLTTTVRSDFTVTRGQLQYFGTPDLNAVVDIDAQHVVRRLDQNINVSVHIGGTLYTPRLTLSSDIRPPIPETEIISLLLFGTSSVQALAQNGNNQGLLNSAVSTVSGYAAGVAAAAVSSQIEQSLITDLGVPLDFLQIRPGDVAGGSPLAGTQVAVGKQVTVLGLPTFLMWSPRLCPQQAATASLANVSAEMKLSQQWALAVSRDPVGSCAGLASAVGSTLRYQFGLDLFWERIY